MSQSECNDIESAIDAGRQIAEADQTPVRIDGGIPFIVLSQERQASSVERFLLTPTRKSGTVAIRDAASFVAYVTRFADPGSLIFADLGKRTMTAVLDYHEAGAGAARWGNHRAEWTCLLTPDWKKWAAIDGKPQSQIEFANFLESMLPTIASPAGAVVLEIARTLEATKSVNFATSVRLDNGQHQLKYEETITGSANKGQFQIPASITLGIVPFEGADAYHLEARFRYRIEQGGGLKMWVDLVRPEVLIEDAFLQARAAITSALGGVLVLSAVAPASA